MFGHENPSAVARVIDAVGADVVALQEVDFSDPQNGAAPCNQAQWIGERLNMRHRFYALRPSRRGAFGLGLLSKVPLSAVKTGVLPNAGDRPTREPRGAMWYRLQTRYGQVSIVNTHLSLWRQDRRLQIEHLMCQAWLGSLSAEEPVIVCGDLNAGVRSPVYRVLTSRYSDVQLQTRQKGYPRRTFFSYRPFRRLDHIFVSPHLRIAAVEVPRSQEARLASDHLPVCAQLIRSLNGGSHGSAHYR